MTALLHIFNPYIFQTHLLFFCGLEILFSEDFYELIVLNMYFSKKIYLRENVKMGGRGRERERENLRRTPS